MDEEREVTLTERILGAVFMLLLTAAVASIFGAFLGFGADLFAAVALYVVIFILIVKE